MSTIKSLVIYVLSVLIAFESGILVFIAGMVLVKHEVEGELTKRKEVTYKGYYDKGSR